MINIKGGEKMAASIHTLLICHSCHKRIKSDSLYTEWEESIYCEPCFDKYLDLITPKSWENK